MRALSAPQRRALRVALLREEPEGGSPIPHRRGRVPQRAPRPGRAGPVLVAVDDVQWLDSPSSLALAFAIRRLTEEPIGVLLVRRTDESADLLGGLHRPLAGEGFTRIAVGPLDLPALQQLLQARLGITFLRATLIRIHAASGGNPLFALEIGRSLGNEPVRLEAGADLPLPDELMPLLGDQVAGLPAETRDALAIVAVLARPDAELVAQVVEAPSTACLQPAVDANVIAVDAGRIRFTHPLRRSAALARTSPTRRREIHARLASIVADPEERARHLALATDGPDEATAAALEDAARRAVARGAPDTAAELAALAGRLTPADRPEDAVGGAWTRPDTPGPPATRSGRVASSRICSPPVLPALPVARFSTSSATCISSWIRGPRPPSAARPWPRRAPTICCGCAASRCSPLRATSSARTCREALAHGRAELELAERLGDEVSVATALRSLARNEQKMTGRRLPS